MRNASLIGKMYAELVAWAREHMLDSQLPLANPEDRQIPLCVGTADEAISSIRGHHASWKKEQAAMAKPAIRVRGADRKRRCSVSWSYLKPAPVGDFPQASKTVFLS